jgi:hypothetical protein
VYNIDYMKVIADGNIIVKVYCDETFQKHHLPHCHVFWPDGSLIVTLPTLDVIVGGNIPKRIRIILLDNFNTIIDAWNQLNPERILK